ncbi:cupin domain-containing protein [Streptomyces sp. H27-D2]|uniref:cupin domain-containing protein n=1 Tax=Streptomyces sp. H27-D2 TaxID=3046304 RepID=UPI002DBFA343|nr:cupin domain-containing protein [Streptomyces sp. H27-D2]MEC4018073.1 cupin domain-containing protein [Streptomyces sp. H27-D2]
MTLGTPAVPAAASSINLAERLSRFSELWMPKKIADLNDYEVKITKLKGEFIWHTHEDTDELFIVISGLLTIQLRDGDVTLAPGELYVVPRGVEHCPRADEETAILLLEPAGVANTGDAGGERTAVLETLR